MSELEVALDRSPAVRAARSALAGSTDAWFVGGAVRDALLGREVVDVDVAISEGEEAAARALAVAARGRAFPLSEEFGAWRAVAEDRSWHADVVRLRGAGIEADLEARDFTVNAIAVPLAGGEPLDPHGGRADIASKALRAVAERSFEDDPLRILRAARLAAELDLEVEPGTVALARAGARRAAEPAGERQFAELRRLVAGQNPMRGLRLLDDLGATEVVLPELDALRGIEQSPYHHLDVYGHTMNVLQRLLELEEDLGAALGRAEVDAVLEEPLADELTRRGALRFGALFHDLGKPETRREVEGKRRVTFIGHDQAGAAIVARICDRFATSRRLSAYLEGMCRHHLRLGFLVHARPLTRRQVYDYLRATEPDAVDITLLTIADRLATAGERTRREAIDDHLELAREMVAEALAWRRSGPPRAPIRGDELAAELEIEPGPQLGRLLGEIEAAVFAGEVSDRDQAVEFARELRAGGRG